MFNFEIKSWSRLTLVTLIGVTSVTMLFGLEACGQQVSDLKIVDLEGDQVVRIDAGGAVFDATDKKVATVNDREGSFTFLKPQAGDNQKIVFKNDPAVQRDNDRYVVKIGDGATFDVKPDGSVLFNGQPWARVFGYTQNAAQKDRFLAAICIFPLVREGPFVSLPRNTKNAEPDRAIKTQPKIWIPSNDEIYVDDDLIQKADFDSRLGEKISEFLKRPAGANKLVYIASSIDVKWGTVVNVINRVRERGVDRIGLIVQGDDHTKKRFLLQILPQRDPNEDISKWKPSSLPLGVVLATDLQLKLIRGGIADAYGHFPLDFKPYGNSEAKGTLNDTSDLSQTLARIFQQRKQQHEYKPGMETRSDVPEDERVEKTVVIKAYRSCWYADVIKVIDVVKGAGANLIVLQLDDLL
jgi:biopolymer transport protein ExbD